MAVADFEYRKEKKAKKKAYKELKEIARSEGKEPPPNPYPSAIKEIQAEEKKYVMDRFYNPKVYTVVENIEARLSEHGHHPRTEPMLFDIEDEDEDDADVLSYHSERLAIALALIASAPIRIMMISQVYGREIITRDQTRFHHFRISGVGCVPVEISGLHVLTTLMINWTLQIINQNVWVV
ncbi:hypothetical protein C2845_PM18G14600 [Panicum miliaceum]|uniref:DYW domain-containing protein n=1 Tax=Panicum miliaceum TaxID=4540 RepID=A0A3L6PJI2_PANMI|nr:hypothetical protein C2845_PM18G14600 [Panicum miliaceum]